MSAETTGSAGKVWLKQRHLEDYYILLTLFSSQVVCCCMVKKNNLALYSSRTMTAFWFIKSKGCLRHSPSDYTFSREFSRSVQFSAFCRGTDSRSILLHTSGHILVENSPHWWRVIYVCMFCLSPPNLSLLSWIKYKRQLSPLISLLHAKCSERAWRAQTLQWDIIKNEENY